MKVDKAFLDEFWRIVDDYNVNSLQAALKIYLGEVLIRGIVLGRKWFAYCLMGHPRDFTWPEEQEAKILMKKAVPLLKEHAGLFSLQGIVNLIFGTRKELNELPLKRDNSRGHLT